jgi:hypothetical protein
LKLSFQGDKIRPIWSSDKEMVAILVEGGQLPPSIGAATLEGNCRRMARRIGLKFGEEMDRKVIFPES